MEEENNVVKDEEQTPSQPSEGEKQVEKEAEEPTQPAPAKSEASAPGSKTESELLLKSLQEERDKRRELESRAKELEEQIEDSTSAEEYSDEGKRLKKELDSVKGTLKSFREERDLEKVYTQYPALKDKAQDFEQYRSKEHPGAKIESVAKLYLSEQGMLEPQRKGLENPTGGDRQPTKPGMSIEEVKHLRETNYKKYKELLDKDQIKFN